MIKLQEIPIPARFKQGGYAILYIPTLHTVYVTGDAMHADLAREVNLDPHEPYYFGEMDSPGTSDSKIV